MAKKKAKKKSRPSTKKDVEPAATKKEVVGESPTTATEQPVNSDFESAAGQPPEPAVEKRGGKRDGAGRPMGLTDEKAKVKNLPQYPNQTIKQGIESLYEFWAAATKIEQLALAENESVMLSLPVTQIQAYYFPNLVKEHYAMFVALIWAVVKINKPRIKLIKEIQRLRQEGKELPQAEQGKKDDDAEKTG